MNCPQVAKQIIRIYNKNLLSLDLPHQSHFATRMWRITNDDKYISPIAADFKIQTGFWSKHMSLMEQRNYRLKTGLKLLQAKSYQSVRGKKKEEFYRQNPERLFYIELINYLFHRRSYGLKTKNCLQGINLENFLFNSEQIKFDPSEIANTATYLKFLKIVDYEAEFRKIFLGFWFSQKNLPDWLFKNKIYGLAHLLIADSWFYQRFVSEKSFAAICGYFEKNIDRIITQTNPDIIAEAGVCFRLTKKDCPALGKIKNFLAGCFDKNLGYLPRKGRSFEAAEHRNIAAILVLANYDRLYSGPNLVNYI